MSNGKNANLINLVKELSNNFTTIIPKILIDQYSELKWGMSIGVMHQ